MQLSEVIEEIVLYCSKKGLEHSCVEGTDSLNLDAVIYLKNAIGLDVSIVVSEEKGVIFMIFSCKYGSIDEEKFREIGFDNLLTGRIIFGTEDRDISFVFSVPLLGGLNGEYLCNCIDLFFFYVDGLVFCIHGVESEDEDE